MFTDEANFLPSIMVGDMCGGKKSNLKTVAPRNMIGCVVRHYWLSGVSYDCSTDVYAILEEDLTGYHYKDEIKEAFVTLILVLLTRILWLWAETPFRVGLVVSMSTLSAKGIGCLDWHDPPLMLIQQSMYRTYSKNIQVLGQLNHRCGMTSQTRSFRIG